MTNLFLHFSNRPGVSESLLLETQPKLGSHIIDRQIQSNHYSTSSSRPPINPPSNTQSHEQLGWPRSLLDIASTMVAEDSLHLTVEDGLDQIKLHASKYETIGTLKLRIASILNCHSANLDLFTHQNLHYSQNQMLGEIFQENWPVVSVRRKIPSTSMSKLVSQFRDAHSVASGSDNIEYEQPVGESPGNKKGQKSEFSLSMRNIKEHKPEGKEKLKQSSIQPYTMHKNQVKQVEEYSTTLLKILDVKEAMSFGSLQESRASETYAEVQNEEGTMYWRLCCPYGCRVMDVKEKLAKIEKLEFDRIQFVGVEDEAMIEDLGSFEDPASLVFRIKQ